MPRHCHAIPLMQMPAGRPRLTAWFETFFHLIRLFACGALLASQAIAQTSTARSNTYPFRQYPVPMDFVVKANTTIKLDMVVTPAQGTTFNDVVRIALGASSPSWVTIKNTTAKVDNRRTTIPLELLLSGAAPVGDHVVTLNVISGRVVHKANINLKVDNKPASPSDTLSFAGYTWKIKSGDNMGPGPNTWDKRNAWVDNSGYLHLKLSKRSDGKWASAQVNLTERLGFGSYQVKLIGRPDLLDRHVVLGLFGYTQPDIGPDMTNEIDIEFAQWGNDRNPHGNWSIWPAVTGLPYATHRFPIKLSGNYSTHRYQWSSQKISFQSLHGHQDDNTSMFANWTYQPQDSARRIPQKALPFQMNLWLFKGLPPTDGKEVEIIISDFKFVPVGK